MLNQMMHGWVGYAVSINCGETLGCYQGTILEADDTTITLTKAFRNGYPYPKSLVTLNGADIKQLQIIEEPPKKGPNECVEVSTVAVSRVRKRLGNLSLNEELRQSLELEDGAFAYRAARGYAGGQNARGLVSVNYEAAACGTGGRNKRGYNRGRGSYHGRQYYNQAAQYRNPENFIGTGAIPKIRGAIGRGGRGGGRGAAKARRRPAFFADEADFEGLEDCEPKDNLPNKKCLKQIRNSYRPDVVRQIDTENAVEQESDAPLDYVTDEGVVVPAAGPRVRSRLWAALRRLALYDCAHILMARAIADVALRLMGGDRRLDACNAHQTPTVVVLVGPHAVGATGLATARLLVSHGVRAVAMLAADMPPPLDPSLQRELDKMEPAGVQLVPTPETLPGADVVLLALHDPEARDDQTRYAAALHWVSSVRAAIVALEPPSQGWEGVRARAAVVGLVPPPVDASLGRMYLANVAAPTCLFAEHNIAYKSPFGETSVLALYPADD